MFQPVYGALLLILLAAASCRPAVRTEKEDVAYWNSAFIDSSYRLLYQQEDTSRALHYFDTYLKGARGVTVYPRAARFVLLANYHYFFSSQNTVTARMIDSALALYGTPALQHHYPRTYVGLLLFGGQIAYRLSQYSKANEYYFRAKKLADAHLDPCERTAFNYSIAMVSYRQQNYRQSLHHFKEAYALQATCAPQTRAVVLQQQEIQSNIGLCFVHLKSYDSALLHFNKALQVADQYRDSLGAATMDQIYGVIYGNKAMVLMAEGRLDEAERLSLESIALNDREGYEVENAAGVKLQLAEVYGWKKDFASMIGLLRSMQDRNRQLPQQKLLEWKRLMAAYYEQTARPDSALGWIRAYTALKDSISKEQAQLTEADVTRQLNEKEQQLQITALKKDKQIALISLWVTVVFSVKALVIIFLVYQNYRRSKKSLAVSLVLNEEIRRQKIAREQEAMQRHRLITEAVIRAQEKERSYIGLELHDNINQVLTTVKLHNEMVLEGLGDHRILLPRTLNYLQDCINEIRSLSKRLSGPTLGKISLEESVKDLLDSINLTSGVKITRHITGLGNEVLRQDLHIGLYRILQEQLNNVLKHSEASEVIVQLERNEGQIRLIVKDNGRGFAMHHHTRGIGLMNMRTRAEHLNGTFDLISQPGQGCRVEVVLPCAQAAI